MNQLVDGILKAHGSNPATFVDTLPGVFTGRVPGERAGAAWIALRDAFADSGLWPIIRGDPDDADALEECAEAVASPADAPSGSVAALLATQFAEHRDMFDQFGIAAPAADDAVAFARAADAANIHAFGGRTAAETSWPTAAREWPATPQFQALTIDHKRPLLEVLFLLVRVEQPYHAAAVLGFGGWNDAPDPLTQTAVLREWHARFAAVPAVMTNDVLECVVGRPPQDEAASYALAAEQWIFCDDIVSQGTQSIRNLAIEIWRSPQWFFWWD